MTVRKRFWLSWLEPFNDGEIGKMPLGRGVLGVWVTGQTCGMEPECATICALVEAPDVDTAAKRIERIANPHSWRFQSPKPDGWTPISDRFPHPCEGDPIDGCPQDPDLSSMRTCDECFADLCGACYAEHF